ncbi:MAG: hypothetical protein ABFD75_01435, partial [Smithella sp.]
RGMCFSDFGSPREISGEGMHRRIKEKRRFDHGDDQEGVLDRDRRRGIGSGALDPWVEHRSGQGLCR